MKRSPWGVFVAALALALLLAAPASGRDRVVEVATGGPGPERFDHVDVRQVGPASPDTVLVLMPGTSGGAGDFTLVAKALTDRVEGLAVWSIDRRSQPLEDTANFRRALRGDMALGEMYDYYLGWLVNGGQPPEHFEFVDPATVPFAKRWGMKTALRDARKVVTLARAEADRVLLGGHSLGASLTAAYGAWDFHGRPGYSDVDGLLLIDGGLLGSFDAYDKHEAKQQVASLDGDPFLHLLGPQLPPEAAGLFAEVGGIYAGLRPKASASLLQSYPLLPDEFNPSFPVTNRALLGHAFDRDTSPDSLSLLHLNGGRLAASGDPRDWDDGGITPIRNVAATFGQEPTNAVEWYFPRRLTIDTNGANAMRENEVARYLGLRLEHTRGIDVPIYAFQSDLTDGGVLAGARRLIDRARTTPRESKLVEGAPQASHLDPLTAAPARNEFLKTVVRFIESTG